MQIPSPFCPRGPESPEKEVSFLRVTSSTYISMTFQPMQTCLLVLGLLFLLSESKKVYLCGYNSWVQSHSNVSNIILLPDESTCMLYLSQNLNEFQPWPTAWQLSAGQPCPADSTWTLLLLLGQLIPGWFHCQSGPECSQQNYSRCTTTPADLWCLGRGRKRGGWTWPKQCQWRIQGRWLDFWGVLLLHLSVKNMFLFTKGYLFI